MSDAVDLFEDNPKKLALGWIKDRPFWNFFAIVFLSWFFGHFGLSIMWALWIVPLAIGWDRIRFHRSVRQYASKTMRLLELHRQLHPDYESTRWLNRIVSNCWSLYRPYINSVIEKSAKDSFENIKVGGISRMMLKNVNLGNAFPTLSNAYVHETASNVLKVDADLRFDSNVYAEFMAYPLISPIPLKLLIKDFFFSARFSMELELLPQPPFTDRLRFSFLGTPELDITIKPMEILPDILSIPLLESSLRNSLQEQLMNLNIDLKLGKANEEEVKIDSPVLSEKDSRGVGKALSGTVLNVTEGMVDAGKYVTEEMVDAGKFVAEGMVDAGKFVTEGMVDAGKFVTGGFVGVGKGMLKKIHRSGSKKKLSQDSSPSPESSSADSEKDGNSFLSPSKGVKSSKDKDRKKGNEEKSNVPSLSLPETTTKAADDEGGGSDLEKVQRKKHLSDFFHHKSKEAKERDQKEKEHKEREVKKPKKSKKGSGDVRSEVDSPLMPVITHSVVDNS